MNCRGFQKRLYEYLDGTLSSARSVAAEKHLGGCRACREAVREEQEVAQFLSARLQQSAEAIALDPGLEGRIARTLRQKPASVGDDRPLNRLWPRFAWPLAAAVLSIVAILAGRFFFAGRVSQPQTVSIKGGARQSDVIIHVSYGVPTYTFRREGNVVTDAITYDTRVENGSLFVRN